VSSNERFLDLDYRIRQAVLVLIYMIILAAAFAFLSYARPAITLILTVLSPFMVAMIVAYIFNPIVRLLQIRFRLRRIAGVTIAYAVILTITALFFAVLLPVIYYQLRNVIQDVVARAPDLFQKIVDWLEVKIPEQEFQRIKDLIMQQASPGALAEQAGSAVGLFAEKAIGTGKFFTNFVLATISVVLGFLAFVTFVVVITFYFLLDYSRFEHVARVLLPDDQENRVFEIWKKIDRALGGFLRGQLIVACVVAAMYTVALMLLGMKPYAILIGFFAGMGNLIPYLGPIFGGVPAGLWVIFGDRFDTGQEKMIGLGIVVLIGIIVQAVDGLFLQPRIVGKNAELHPLLVLLALLIGSQFGLGGLIIAVPSAVILRVLVKELWWDPLERREFAGKKNTLPADTEPKDLES
jgi:predicted PurR-regulated permease PerM